MLSWNFPAWRVDDEIDIAILDAIENVRASLVNFEDLGYLDFPFRKRLGGSAGGMISKPSFTNSRATGITASLSVSLTLTKTFPFFGSGGGAAICDFA